MNRLLRWLAVWLSRYTTSTPGEPAATELPCCKLRHRIVANHGTKESPQ